MPTAMTQSAPADGIASLSVPPLSFYPCQRARPTPLPKATAMPAEETEKLVFRGEEGRGERRGLDSGALSHLLGRAGPYVEQPL